ncbi:gliding motility-associated C-terminal domain-containing protein [Xanthovirga aplysinae]|uniref:T9SS type B sorting domain-containing protein n=1 Tax=Xanthovirga aplysinae TaxID=2529853 RepID=UPI0012BC6438|nr:gliding motility-associated C-terminal domain-containing protein [Xanthovirga aplysinae]MTI32175.1 gliding motility-associated C-terminal domain-containing protein [Xanthovirga aplysinae]
MKKSIYSFLFFWLFIPASLLGTHIVGGEFELIHLDGQKYRLNLIQYVDDINSGLPNDDPDAIAYIFDKKENKYISQVTLYRSSSENVPYTNIDCTDDDLLKTRKLIYSAEIYLSQEVYNDPQGYYVVYERCCRNNVIDNVYRPADNTVGQTFYLEFPPVVKDNNPFINSSPILFPPLRDYACVGRKFYFDFGGTDMDDDSLHYSLVTPLTSSTLEAIPVPQPAPHEEVTWADWVEDKVIPGNPSLEISGEGFLTVQPEFQGLYVFGVKCEEFRNGIKIGEVRRDFQLLVINCPDPGEPPRVQIKDLDSGDFLEDGTTLILRRDQDYCLQAIVTDPDGGENVSLITNALNFDPSKVGFSGKVEEYLKTAEDSLKTEWCVTDCNDLPEEMEIEFIARDDACSLPLSDTLKLNLKIESAFNNAPNINSSLGKAEVDVYLGEVLAFELWGEDLDPNDLIRLSMGTNFSPSDYGIDFTPVEGYEKVESSFRWELNCEKIDLDVKDEFIFYFTVEDDAKCVANNYDTFELKVNVLPPENEPPVMEITNLSTSSLELLVGETLSFGLLGTDEDIDLIELKWEPQLDDNVAEGFSFVPKEGRGEVESDVVWSPNCSHLGENGEEASYDFTFVVADRHCSYSKGDTVSLRVTVKDIFSDFDNFLPANAFTPNGDGIGDYYFIENLPKDNCQNQFLGIQIYNRWGREVYASNARDFKWDGGGFSSGVYYLRIEYTEAVYKGVVNILY